MLVCDFLSLVTEPDREVLVAAASHFIALCKCETDKLPVELESLTSSMMRFERYFSNEDLEAVPQIELFCRLQRRNFNLMAVPRGLSLFEMRFFSNIHGRFATNQTWDHLSRLITTMFGASMDTHFREREPNTAGKELPPCASSEELENLVQRTHDHIIRHAMDTKTCIVSYLFDPLDPTKTSCRLIKQGEGYHVALSRSSVNICSTVQALQRVLSGDIHFPFERLIEISSLDSACHVLHLKDHKAWLKRAGCSTPASLSTFLVHASWQSAKPKPGDPIDDLNRSRIICRKCAGSYVWAGQLDEQPLNELLERLGFDSTQTWVNEWLSAVEMNSIRELKVRWRELHCESNVERFDIELMELVEKAPVQHRSRIRSMLSVPFDAYLALRTLYDHLIAPIARFLPKLSQKQLEAPSPSDITEVVFVPSSILVDVPFTCLIGPDGTFLIEKFEISVAQSICSVSFGKKNVEGLPQKPREGHIFVGNSKTTEYSDLSFPSHVWVTTDGAAPLSFIGTMRNNHFRSVMLLSAAFFPAERNTQHTARVHMLDPPGCFRMRTVGKRNHHLSLEDQLLYVDQIAGAKTFTTEVLFLDMECDRGAVDHRFFYDGIFEHGFSTLSRSLLYSGIPHHVLSLWSVDREVSIAVGRLFMTHMLHPLNASRSVPHIFRQVCSRDCLINLSHHLDHPRADCRSPHLPRLRVGQLCAQVLVVAF
jgi:hypothetical protein